MTDPDSSGFRRTVELSSGQRVTLRSVEPGDRDAVADGYRQLSTSAAFERFHTLKPELARATLDFLTEVDHRDHEAIGAVDPAFSRGVGIARYIRSEAEPTRAEVAVVVLDDWQGLGLGRRLLEAVRDRARDEDVTCLTAEVMSDNERMLGLLRAMGPVSLDRSGSETTAHLPI